MYSVRMRLVISLPSLFLATGSRICSPVLKSPSQPLSDSVYPWRWRKPSPATLSPEPPTLSSRLRTLPRFGTSCSSVPLARVMSTGLLIQKSMLYSTMPRALRGASLMSVMTSFSGSFGSTSPKATPLSVSYCPTLPKDAPPKATARELIWILVIRASTGSPTLASVMGNTPIRSARMLLHIVSSFFRKRCCGYLAFPPHCVFDSAQLADTSHRQGLNDTLGRLLLLTI